MVRIDEPDAIVVRLLLRWRHARSGSNSNEHEDESNCREKKKCSVLRRAFDVDIYMRLHSHAVDPCTERQVDMLLPGSTNVSITMSAGVITFQLYTRYEMCRTLIREMPIH